VVIARVIYNWFPYQSKFGWKNTCGNVVDVWIACLKGLQQDIFTRVIAIILEWQDGTG